MSEWPPSEGIVLYGDRLWESPYVFSAFVAVKEKGLPLEVRELDLDRGDQHAAYYRDLSLTGRVPCIEHRGLAFTESLAIIEYLDETYPPPKYTRLLPAETGQRARARQILGWLRSDLLPLREERPTSTIFFAPAKAKLSDNASAAAQKLLRIADEVIPLGEGDLFGSWSIVDSELTLMLQRLIANRDSVPERIARYAARQWQRPSVQAYVKHERPPLAS